MTNKIINNFKLLFLFSSILFSVIACEKDFEDIGVNIVDNNLFDTSVDTFEVISYTQNIERSEVLGDNLATPQLLDGLPVFNIGILKDPSFGTLKASFISQVQMPLNGIDFGSNPVIDTVILDIPYFATSIRGNADTEPKFELDSIFGSSRIADSIRIRVYRSGTFLNTLDPTNPTQNKRYFSDEDFEKADELYSEKFRPNANDTMLLVTRQFFTEPTDDTVVEVDTIKENNLSPSIKLPLNKEKIKQIFIDDITDSDAATSEAFLNYFRGIIIEPEEIEIEPGEISDVSLIMQLALNNANINIYYTNEISTNETETTGDLNGNGTTNDEDVPVKTKQTLTMSVGGIRTAVYDRNYSTAAIQAATQLMNQFNAPDTINGHKKLFVQGAAGSMAVIDLSKELDETKLAEIRNKNRLINGAVLDIYVDDDDDSNNEDLYLLPRRLYMYKLDDNSVIEDVITEAQVFGINGFLERDDSNKPTRYRFLITDYISNVLKTDNPSALSKLALKMYHSTDATLSLNDTIVRDFSWNPKGVVLFGNKEVSGSEAKKLELKIYYSEVNN